MKRIGRRAKVEGMGIGKITHYCAPTRDYVIRFSGTFEGLPWTLTRWVSWEIVELLEEEDGT